jgi:dolichol-phosphate mannosyltransferase
LPSPPPPWNPACTVVIPTFNERENLPQLVARLMQMPRVRVLVVDDGSPDGTGDVADNLATQFAAWTSSTGRSAAGSAPHTSKGCSEP